MFTLYVFSLVLGGGFLALSVIGGVLGGAADADLQLDGGDLGGDLAGHGDLDVHADAHMDGHSDTHAAAKIFSIRMIVYFLFGFGAVGTVMSYLGAATVATAGFSLAGGAISGTLVTRLFHWLQTTESGEQERDDSFVGLAGTVTLPLSESSPGAVAVERGGKRVRLRALPHAPAETDPASWSSVVVVDMVEGIARVAPVDRGLASPAEDP